MLDTRGNIALACALSALAGYVDGIGFIHLGGLFVSFMSGNSTRLGVMLSEQHFTEAWAAAWLIILFVAGAAAGSLIVLGRGGYRQSLVLLAEAILLGLAAGFAALDLSQLAVIAIVIAMGLENAVFQIGGGAGLGLTYVTGALVKVGQLIAAALTGGAPFAWLPNLGLWASLVVGTLIGAWAYGNLALGAIWFAAATALLLAAIVAWAQRGEVN
jgi:uncharacterized membrane protein YoaK (UPF0700 family)